MAWVCIRLRSSFESRARLSRWCRDYWGGEWRVDNGDIGIAWLLVRPDGRPAIDEEEHDQADSYDYTENYAKTRVTLVVNRTGGIDNCRHGFICKFSRY